MNLNELFKIQAKLDNRIVEEHNLQGVDLLDKKVLALQVELGNLAQNWHEFKFWSKDQDTRKKVPCIVCNETGEVYEPIIGDYRECFYCDGSGTGLESDANLLLEEYVDCLHLILSIGLELRMDEVVDEFDFKYASGKEVVECFIGLNLDISNLYYDRDNDGMNSYFYESIFSEFIKLGKMLGFTWEQIEQAYLDKNKTNLNGKSRDIKCLRFITKQKEN